MHSDYARQGTRVMKANRDAGGMEILAEATSDENAEEIVAALERTEMDSPAARAIRQSLGDFSFETRRYIDSTKASIRQEEQHLRECPDCKHSKGRLETNLEMLDALQERLDGITDAYRLYARVPNDEPDA